MRRRIVVGVSAVIGVVTLLASSSTAYAAPGDNANATAVKSTLLDLPITLSQANCPGPPSSPQSAGPIVLGNLTIGLLKAECTSGSAKSSVASIRSFDPSDWRNTFKLDAIASSCKSYGRQRSSTVTIKNLLNRNGDVGPVTTPLTLTNGTISVFLNEQFESNGFIGVNAVRIQLGGTDQGQNLILGQSQCAVGESSSSTDGGGGGGISILGIRLF
jgi:hypothetical protein